MEKQIKAIIFDMGGVLIEGPRMLLKGKYVFSAVLLIVSNKSNKINLDTITHYNLDPKELLNLFARHDLRQEFNKSERGELSMAEFAETVSRSMSEEVSS